MRNTHADVYVPAHPSRYERAYTHTHIRKRTCMHACIQTDMHAYQYMKYLYIAYLHNACAHTRRHINMHTQACMYADRQTDTHADSYTYTSLQGKYVSDSRGCEKQPNNTTSNNLMPGDIRPWDIIIPYRHMSYLAETYLPRDIRRPYTK